MLLTNRHIRMGGILLLLAVLIILAFIVVRPVFISIATGFILAFILLPVYKRVYSILGERNTSALAVCVLLILVVFIPLWFLVPVIIRQGFGLFSVLQTLDVAQFVTTIFPGTPDQFKVEMTNVIISFISNISSTIFDALIKYLFDLPRLLLHFTVILFVFFYAIRDYDKLSNFVSGISPLRKDKEKRLALHFKDMTKSIIFGHVFLGIIQGIATGVGMLVFGVPQALFLTLFAVIAGVIPVIGTWIVWIPAAIFLFTSGHTGAAIGFTLYCVLFVSTIDNFLRPYIVSVRTGVSSGIVLVGMIGGLFVFGILGLILGPLILSYLVVFLQAYKDKTLLEMFSDE